MNVLDASIPPASKPHGGRDSVCLSWLHLLGTRCLACGCLMSLSGMPRGGFLGDGDVDPNFKNPEL